MKNNKKNFSKSIVIVPILIIAIVIVVGVMWQKGIIFSSENNNYMTNLDKNNDGLPDSGEFKVSDGIVYKNEKVVYDPNDSNDLSFEATYEGIEKPTKDNLTEESLTSYLKNLIQEIKTDSYSSFDKNNIHKIMAAISTPCYFRTTKEAIKNIAKMYFNVDNYELPVATYDTNISGKIDIVRLGAKYIAANNWNYGCHFLSPFYKYVSHEVKGNNVTAKYKLVEYEEDYSNNIKKTYGELTIKLEFINDNLIVKSAKYKASK